MTRSSCEICVYTNTPGEGRELTVFSVFGFAFTNQTLTSFFVMYAESMTYVSNEINDLRQEVR